MSDDKNRKQIKSVIIDSELPEWEEWGNRYFGNGNQSNETRNQNRVRENRRDDRRDDDRGGGRT